MIEETKAFKVGDKIFPTKNEAIREAQLTLAIRFFKRHSTNWSAGAITDAATAVVNQLDRANNLITELNALEAQAEPEPPKTAE